MTSTLVSGANWNCPPTNRSTDEAIEKHEAAFDRRIVHAAIKDDPDIETHSVEAEDTDKIVALLRPKR